MTNNTKKALAIIICFLLVCPTLAWGAEDNDVTTLKEVEVTASPLEKYLVTTSVITEKDIKEKGAQNLAEALKDLPGLNIHRGGGKDTTVVEIRGMNIDYTKIIIDGVPFNPISDRKVDLRMFPTDNIAKIEVVKGPTPVIYGTDAIGGTILITTKNGKDSPGGKVSLYAGEYNTLNTAVSYGGGNEKFNYFVNGALENTDGFRKHTKRDAKYINTKLNWQLNEKSSLTILGGYSITNKDGLNKVDPVSGNTLESACRTCSFWPGLDDWEFRDWKKTHLALNYQSIVNEKVDYTVKLYRFTDKNGLWAYGDPPPGIPNNKKDYVDNRWNASYWDSSLTGAEFQSNLKLNSSHILTLGTSHVHNDWKSTDTKSNKSDPNNYEDYWRKYEIETKSYYLQDNFTPNDRTTITLGVRHEQNKATNFDGKNKDKSVTNPTVNVVYQANEKTTLRAAFGKTCRFPTAKELFDSSRGNADLKAQEAESYEVGLKHRFSDSLSGDFAVFQNNIDNWIGISPSTNKFSNIESVRTRGIEMELNKKFSNRLTGFLGYTYLDAKNLTNEKNVEYTPHNSFSYGITYKGDRGYSFSLNGRYIGKRETGDVYDAAKDDGRTVKQSYPTLSSYHVMNLKVSREVNPNQDWFVMVNNLLDQKYEDELFYPAPGRQVMAGTNFKF